MLLLTLHKELYSTPLIFAPLLKTTGYQQIAVPQPSSASSVVVKNCHQAGATGQGQSARKPVSKTIQKRDQKAVSNARIVKPQANAYHKESVKKVEPTKLAIVSPSKLPPRTIQQNTAQQDITSQQKIQEKKEGAVSPVESAQIITIGADDLELLTLTAHVKQELVKTWKRPTNVPASATCEMCITVAANGSHTVAMVQSSRAVILDMSVRNFLLQYTFPKQVWGRKLSIIF